jgi:predicted ATP-dependent serine protease
VCELQEAAMENIREVMEHEKEKFLIVKSHFKAISKPESQPTSISNKNNFTAHL